VIKFTFGNIKTPQNILNRTENRAEKYALRNSSDLIRAHYSEKAMFSGFR